MKTKLKILALLLAAVCVFSFNVNSVYASEKKTLIAEDSFNDMAYEGTVNQDKWLTITSNDEDSTILQSSPENPSMEFVTNKSGGEQVQYGTAFLVNDIQEVRFSFYIPETVQDTWLAINFVTELQFSDSQAGAHLYDVPLRCFINGAMFVIEDSDKTGRNSNAWVNMLGEEYDGNIRGKWVSVKIVPVSDIKANVYFALREKAIDATIFPTEPGLVIDRFPDGNPDKNGDGVRDESYTSTKFNFKNAYVLWACEAPGKGIKLDDLYVKGTLPAGSMAEVDGSDSGEVTVPLELSEDFTSSVLSEDFTAYFSNKASTTFETAFKFSDDNKLNFDQLKVGDRIIAKNRINIDDSVVQDISVIDVNFNLNMRNNEGDDDKLAFFFGIPNAESDPLQNSYMVVMGAELGYVAVYEDGVITKQTAFELADATAKKGSNISIKVRKDGTVIIYEGERNLGSFPVAENIGGYLGFCAVEDNESLIEVDGVSIYNSSYVVPLTKSLTHNFSNDFFGNEGYKDFYLPEGGGNVSVENGKLVYKGAVDNNFFGSAYEYDSFIMDYQLCNIYVGTDNMDVRDRTAEGRWHGLDVGRRSKGLSSYGSYAMILFQIHTADGVEYTYPNIYTKGEETSLQKDNLELVKQIWHKPIPTSLFEDIQYDGVSTTENDIKESDAICIRWVSDATNENLKLYLKKAGEVNFTLYYEVRGINCHGYQALSCTGYTYVMYDNFSIANTSPIFDVANNEAPEVITKTETNTIYDKGHVDVNLEQELILNGLSTNKDNSKKSGCFGSINGGLTALVLAAVAIVLKKKKD